MVNLGAVLYSFGVLLGGTGSAMLVPAAVDWAEGSPDWSSFAYAFLLTIIFSGLLVTSSWNSRGDLTRRDAFLLTVLAWIGISAFSALPFLFSDLHIGFADSFFEAVSGLTTTGSTVLTGLDDMAPGILMWRALLQWIGGIGIIAMAVLMLPFLRVGGMQLFRTESSDSSEKIVARFDRLLISIFAVYTGLTVVCAILFGYFGMTAFEAIVHAMTTLSTGGFSTSDASLAHFSSLPIESTAVLFMLLGSLPFVLYLRFLRGDRMALIGDPQVRVMLLVVAFAILVVAEEAHVQHGTSYLLALRLAVFNVVSVITTTGYVTADYSTWGAFAVAAMVTLTLVGGCTGSTAGGVKIFRFQLLWFAVSAQISRLIQPHRVFVSRYGPRQITDDVVLSVVAFVTAFFFLLFATTGALSTFGLDFTTSFSGAATALANVGPGMGTIIGPVGNFASLPDGAKWVLTAAMLLGRLEVFTILVLLAPRFWRF